MGTTPLTLGKPLQFDAAKARAAGYNEDEILNSLTSTKKFNTTKALAAGYTKEELIRHLSGQPSGTPLPPSEASGTDKLIDFLRPVVAGGAGHLAGLGVAASGVGTGGVSSLAAPAADIGTYTLVDSLMQYLKSQSPSSFGEALTEGGKEAGINYLGGKTIQGLMRGAKATLGMGLPEIQKFLPTTSQAAHAASVEATSPVTKVSLGALRYGAKSLEDLSLTAKQAALDRTAGKGFTEALQVAKDAEFLRTTGGRFNFSFNPQTMLENAQRAMPLGEGSFTPVKFKDLGREVTPVKFVDRGREVTPVKLVDTGREVTPISFTSGEESFTPSKITIGSKTTTPAKYFKGAPKPQPTVLPKENKIFAGGEIEVRPGETKVLKGGEIEALPGETRTIKGGPIEMQRGQPKLNLYDSFSKLDSVIKDPKKLESVLSAAQEAEPNLRRSLQGYQFSKMLNEATERSLTEGTGNITKAVRISPDKINSMWLDPEMQDSLKLLYNSKQRATIEQFFKNVAYTQDKLSTMPIAKRLLILHGGIGIGAGLLTGNIGAGVVASTTTFLGAEAVGRLLTNPKTGRILTALAGGEPLGVSEQYAGKLISQVLQGSTIALLDESGEKHPTKIENGRLIPLE